MAISEVYEQGQVQRISACQLRLLGRAWAFADERRDDIEAHWQTRLKENPKFFNGRVLVMEPPRIERGVLSADMLETDFASFLFWKENGCPNAGLCDGTGSALIRSCEGHVLLARQREGHLNSGLLTLPGGFIDLNDVRDDGRVDIDASIARELLEETGVSVGHFSRRPGYLLTCVGVQISIVVEFRSELRAVELRKLLCDRISEQADPELGDFVVFEQPPLENQSDVVALSRDVVGAVLMGV
ncbi:MAG: NUDIX domain-containing protein [Alphaproteobacteria bacterium]|nr:NUDIX domain-containing protein [Alphaproteobacteria bacterium]